MVGFKVCGAYILYCLAFFIACAYAGQGYGDTILFVFGSVESDLFISVSKHLSFRVRHLNVAPCGAFPGPTTKPGVNGSGLADLHVWWPNT